MSDSESWWSSRNHLADNTELHLPENELFLFLRDTKFVHKHMMDHGITFSVVNTSGGGTDDGAEAGKTVLQAEGEEAQLERLVEGLQRRAQVSRNCWSQENFAECPST